MINKDIYQLKKYCKDYKNIENYTEALSSPLRYDLHHKREISENKSKKDLIADNLYYDRPASELIFLEEKEHIRLHKEGKPGPWKGKHLSTETRKKMSIAKKGKPSPNRGKHLPPEWRAKLSANSAWKGKPAHNKGKHRHIENGHYVYTD